MLWDLVSSNTEQVMPAQKLYGHTGFTYSNDLATQSPFGCMSLPRLQNGLVYFRHIKESSYTLSFAASPLICSLSIPLIICVVTRIITASAFEEAFPRRTMMPRRRNQTQLPTGYLSSAPHFLSYKISKAPSRMIDNSRSMLMHYHAKDAAAILQAMESFPNV